MTEQDDFKLVRECLEGNPKAFELIIDKYQKPIFNIALRLINDYEDAQDITQSVFIKAFENLDTFNPKYKFFSWIYRIVVNESINFLNQRKHLEKLDKNFISKEKTPEEHYYEIEMCERVQDALMDLQIYYRTVIILRHFEDLSYREISYILDTPEKTVKSRLFTARQLLRNILLKKGIVKHD
ncbi:MAG: RNA polymerase sigma factor [bacterium]